MGNLAIDGGNKLKEMMQTQSQPSYTPGIVSSMLSRGEDPGSLPKKSFLAGSGWKAPSSTWSPWDMWSMDDVREGAANAGRRIQDAVRVNNNVATPANAGGPPPMSMLPPIPTSFAPGSGNLTPGQSPTQLPQALPVPTQKPMTELSDTQNAPKPTKKRNRGYRPPSYSPRNTPAGNMGMF